jgi:transcriptional regulator with XRE-family HTH domain
MEENRIIAANIKQWRKDNNLSQADIAEVLDCDNSSYSKLERGEIKFSIKKLHMLSEHYKVNMDKFFTGLQLVPIANVMQTVDNTIECKIEENNLLLQQLIDKVDFLISKTS